jgi:hypothetical protein
VIQKNAEVVITDEKDGQFFIKKYKKDEWEALEG